MLVILEDRMRDLIIKCNDKQCRIEELEAAVKNKDEAIHQAKQTILTLQTRCDNLLTARRLAEDEKEFQQARKRVDKLVRDVDLCIELLNE